ncbi:MAG: hypothetical protein M0T74_04015 [Desulfitobacterium hafniense]|nr:hypothetical protein [Desulfitobacterium hafniense]
MKDKRLGDDSNPKSLNRYSYTTGDPVNFIDPSGESELALFTGAIGLGSLIPVVGEVIIVVALVAAVVVIGTDLIYDARKIGMTLIVTQILKT